ncbi:hypothetical protein K2173_026050 [Erythroxylum novogranatense]|uniref:Protein RALF-like 27 n=1 Tax=Erythroxylum novogranatense TaxID=1862640 RepID=A0AAV8SHW8_9ROSI|nr:hypothetical protein K2173_026050 [Erythroxylum novogranatense]
MGSNLLISYLKFCISTVLAVMITTSWPATASLNGTIGQSNEEIVGSLLCPPAPAPAPAPAPVPSFNVSFRAISYKSLEKQPICNARIYGSCLRRFSNDTRPCTYYTRCRG